MSKKSSTPISLFSFQDIITSLTGIMIVVVLVILLQLVETVSQATAQSGQHPEFQIMRDKLAELRELEKRLEQQLADRKKENKPSPILRMSEAELRYMIRMNTERIQQEQKVLADQNRDSSRLEQEITRIEDRISQQKKQIEELQAKMDYIKELSMKIALLKKRKTEVKNELEKKRKVVSFEFVGEIDRIPILVEVYSWGFRAKVHPDGKVETFGTRGRDSSPLDQVRKLKKWLAGQSDKSYPVLLFRRESLRFHDEIVFRHFQSADIGRELLNDGEECF